MSERSQQRLTRELKALQTSPTATEDGIMVELYDPKKHGGRHGKGNDLFLWHATLAGPADTPFEGGTYSVLLRIPREYPMVPPSAFFQTPIFHPNVQFDNGAVCLDILKSQWSPAWAIRTVVLGISLLLSHPEHSSPFNCDAGNLLREEDQMGYESMVRYYSTTYAGAPRLTWEE